MIVANYLYIIRNYYKINKNRIIPLFYFFSGQTIFQLVSAIGAIILLRLTNKNEYAILTFILAFQSVLSLICDLGFSGTVIPLVGENQSNPQYIGKLICSAKYFKRIFFFCSLPIFFFLFLYFSKHLEWPILSKISSFGAITLFTYYQIEFNIYSNVLKIKKKLGLYFYSQVLSIILRFAIIVILYYLHFLSASLIIWIITFSTLLNSFYIVKQSRRYILEPLHTSKEINMSMFRLIAPQIPQILFFALQGQITVFLLSLNGQKNILAEIGALNRVGQIISLVNSFSLIILQPYIAKQLPSKLMSIFLKLSSLFLVFYFLIALLFYYYPTILIFFLGSQYKNLTENIFLVVVSNLIFSLGFFFYIFQTARRWIFWSGNFFYIASIFLYILFYVYVKGIKNTNDAVGYNFGYSLVHTFVYLIILVTGLLKRSKNNFSSL